LFHIKLISTTNYNFSLIQRFLKDPSCMWFKKKRCIISSNQTPDALEP